MGVLKGFFSTQGRTSRRRLLSTIAAALGIAWIAVLLMRDGSVVVVTLAGALLGLTAAKLAIEAARRRHDMGRSVTPALLLLAATGIAAGALAFHGIAAGPRTLSYAGLLLFLGVAAALLLGSNTPRLAGRPVSKPASSRAGRAGPSLALVLTALGAVSGYAGFSWTEGLTEQHALNEAAAARRQLHRPQDKGVNDLEAIYAKEHPN